MIRDKVNHQDQPKQSFSAKLLCLDRELQTTSIYGSRATTRRGPIKAAGASVKMPMQTVLDAIPIAKEKMIAA